MNKLAINLWGMAIAISLLILIVSGTTKTPPKPKIVDTKVLTCNTSGLAKSYIESWSKKGYKVDKIISQSVSTSIDESYYFYQGSNSHYRDLRGDIIIIMIKEQ